MLCAGTALLGIGTGQGPTRAQDAALAAISSPLLDFPLQKAGGVVFTVTGSADMTLQEINEAAETIHQVMDPNANVIFGALVDDAMAGMMSITVVATGFQDPRPPQVNGRSALSILASTSQSGRSQAGAGGEPSDPNGRRRTQRSSLPGFLRRVQQ